MACDVSTLEGTELSELYTHGVGEGARGDFTGSGRPRINMAQAMSHSKPSPHAERSGVAV